MRSNEHFFENGIHLNIIQEISAGQAQLVGSCLLDPDPEIRKEATWQPKFCRDFGVQIVLRKNCPGSGDFEYHGRVWSSYIWYKPQLIQKSLLDF